MRGEGPKCCSRSATPKKVRRLTPFGTVASHAHVFENAIRTADSASHSTSHCNAFDTPLENAPRQVCSSSSPPKATTPLKHNPRIPQSSYYDARNQPGAALYRARRPYLFKNAITGVCIIGFVGAVCM